MGFSAWGPLPYSDLSRHATASRPSFTGLLTCHEASSNTPAFLLLSRAAGRTEKQESREGTQRENVLALATLAPAFKHDRGEFGINKGGTQEREGVLLLAAWHNCCGCLNKVSGRAWELSGSW